MKTFIEIIITLSLLTGVYTPLDVSSSDPSWSSRVSEERRLPAPSGAVGVWSGTNVSQCLQEVGPMYNVSTHLPTQATWVHETLETMQDRCVNKVMF